MNISANTGPNGEPIATPSIYMNNLSMNLNGMLHTAISNRCFKCIRMKGILGGLGLLYNISKVISIASLTGTLVYKLSTSKLITSNARRCDSLDPRLNATESSAIIFF